MLSKSPFSKIFLFLKNNSFSRDDLEYGNGKIKNIHYGDILVKYSTIKNVNDNDVPYLKSGICVAKTADFLSSGDVVMADTAEDYLVGKTIEVLNSNNVKVVSGLHTIALKPKIQFANGFLGFYFNSNPFKRRCFPLVQGIKVYGISKSALSSLFISYPTLEEQQKISGLLKKIDLRIVTQNKIIEKYKSLINQIRRIIKFKYLEAQKTSLSELCSIKTGKKDANEASKNGKYPFFTCGRETLSIDTYSFEGKALLVSGNGEIGQVKYYDGKFDAYQRTYVLQNFSIKPKYIKIWLETLLPKIIEKEKNVGAMPYIVVSTLANIKIPKLDTECEDNLISLFQAFENKVQECEITLKLYRKQKDFLLSNLFI